MDLKEVVLPVTSPEGSYNVVIGDDILPCLAKFVSIDGAIALISDSDVGETYGDTIDNGSAEVVRITIPSGERHKTLHTVEYVYNQMLDQGLDRQTTVVALGGGVVNDLAGFVAATYMRGVPFVTCPTSLLAMVDASVGGKTGVDMPQGKNLIGAFKQPKAVIVDLSTLRTLPFAEFSSGMAEIIKHGFIADPSLLVRVSSRDWLTELKLRISSEAALQLRALVADAIQVKRDIVQSDPYEQGGRAVLNLGHTFGHAIEQVSGYQLRHGEAVAIGLVCAANLSARLGYCAGDLQDVVESALKSAKLPLRIPSRLDPERLLQAMQRDKKKANGKLRFILLRGIADVFVADNVPEAAVLETLREIANLD